MTPESRRAVDQYCKLIEAAGQTYSPLADLSATDSVNVFGVVTNVREPSKTRGPDYVLAINISDPTRNLTQRGFNVNIFDQNPSALPRITRIGQIVRLCIRVRLFGSQLQGVPVSRSAITIFNESDLSDMASGISNTLRPQERNVIEFMRKWWSQQPKHAVAAFMSPNATSSAAMSAYGSPSVAGSPSNKQWITVKDICAGRFYKIVLQVVKIVGKSESNYNGPLTLAMTDYTRNNCLCSDEYDDIPSTFPAATLSHRIVEVTFWDENVERVWNAKPGDYVMFSNVRCKRGSRGFLELAVHGDKRLRKPSVSLLPADDDHACEIEARRKRLDDRPTHVVDGRLINTPISDILVRESQDEMLPAKYRCHVRVVDHHPKKISAFVRPFCDDCQSSFWPKVITTRPTCPTCKSSNRISLTYMFSLLLSDGTGFLPVIVSGEDAIYFLANLNPLDPNQAPQFVDMLRSRLSAIWKQSDMDTSSPSIRDARNFDCVIQSYTVVAADGSRVPRYKMFNTQINVEMCAQR